MVDVVFLAVEVVGVVVFVTSFVVVVVVVVFFAVVLVVTSLSGSGKGMIAEKILSIIIGWYCINCAIDCTLM